MKQTKNGLKYEDFIRSASWDMADFKKIKEYSSQRRPIPHNLAQKRHDHIVELAQQGVPKKWIADLYRIRRNQVYVILSTPQPTKPLYCV